MKAVIPVVPDELLEQRRRTGADQWDELWEGVLHMPPMPNFDHQGLAQDLEDWLRRNWARPRKGRVYQEVNIAPAGGWPDNYRIPDLILLPRERLVGIRGEYFEGPPLVVVEIRSPGDESYEKLPFYADLGTPEAWIIDRDSRAIEVLVLNRGAYVGVEPDAEGWRTSPATGVQFRPQGERKLALRLESHPADVTMIPEEDDDPQ
jgi:Uma2 family endonuclease